MKLSIKVRFLNFFRVVFTIPILERILVSLTQGKLPSHFVSKLVPNPYQYPPNSFRLVYRNGIKMGIDISDYIGHYYYFGFTDKSLDSLFQLCKEGDNVLDIGTNIGWVAHHLAKISNSGIVFGFEPDPYNFDRCTENIKLNGFKNLLVLPFGLGDTDGSIGMEIRTPTNLGGNRIAPIGTANTREVKISRLDDIESIKKLSKIDLIKIDVEGYELNVLRGGEQTLKKHHPILFIELDDNNLKDQGDSASAVINFLFEIGYQEIEHAESKTRINTSTDFVNCHFDIVAR